MSPQIKNRISNLLTIKSIVTVSLTACFVYQIICGMKPTEQFMMIYMTVIGFYFGTQVDKK